MNFNSGVRVFVGLFSFLQGGGRGSAAFFIKFYCVFIVDLNVMLLFKPHPKFFDR